MRSDVDDPVAFDHDLMIGEKLQLVILARKHPVGLDYQACRCLKFPGSGCRPLALWSEEGLRAAGAAPERGAGPRGSGAFAADDAAMCGIVETLAEHPCRRGPGGQRSPEHRNTPAQHTPPPKPTPPL